MNRKIKGIFCILIMIATNILCFIGCETVAYAKEVPRIILDSYELKEGNFDVGEKTIVILHLKNTSEKITAEDILLTYNANEDLIYSTFGQSNQVYIGKIAAGQTQNIEIELNVSSDAAKESVPISFVAQYRNSSSNEQEENKFYIYAPINSLNFTYDVSVASSATVGDRSYISANITNSTYNDISNVRMTVVGKIDDGVNEEKDILSEEEGNTKVIDMGNVVALESLYKDDSIIFKESGQQKITVAFTYTDKYGEEHYEIAGEYTVNVIDRATNTTTVEVKGAGTTILWFICTIIGIAALVILTIMIVRKKRRGELSVDIIKDYVEKIRLKFK